MDDETLLVALEACLERIERGDSVEMCLSDYPAQRAELEPMLRVAASLRALPAPPPPDLGKIEHVALARAAELSRMSASPSSVFPARHAAILILIAAAALLLLLIGAVLILNTIFNTPDVRPQPSATVPATAPVPSPTGVAVPTATVEASPTATVEVSPTATVEVSPTAIPPTVPARTLEPQPTVVPQPPAPPPAPTVVPQPPAPPPPSPGDDDDDDDDDNDDDDDDGDD